MAIWGLVFGLIMFALGGIWTKKAREASPEQQPEILVGIFCVASPLVIESALRLRGETSLRIFPARFWAVHELVACNQRA